MRNTRGALGALAVAALVGGTLAATPPATAATAGEAAAPVTVDDVDLTWAISKEAGSGAFAPGTWNLVSAGRIGDPGEGGQTLTTANQGATWGNGAAAGWKNTDGDVVVEDLAADGSYAPTTFQGTRTNSTGTQVTAFSGNSENRLVFGAGSGTVDPDAGTASIAWQGDATVLFYSGMTYFHLADPALEVAADGTAELTATVDGYATSMDDPDRWDALPAERVTIATLGGVEVDDDGFTVTPDYREVTYDAPAGATAQNRTAASWGAFPQDFVDFAQLTGAGPYWYSTGGSADARKPAEPLTVAYDATEPATEPTVTVSDTTLLPSGAQDVTVTGEGFEPSAATATRPPLAGKPGGVYVALGSYDEVWRPSQGAPSTSRRNVQSATKWAVLAEDMATIGGDARGAIELTPEGTFSTTLRVDKADVDALGAGAAGIYTYPGGGAVAPSYETATPLTFAKASPTVRLAAPRATYGTAASITATVTGESSPTGDVVLTRDGTEVGTAALDGGSATFTLPARLAAGTHALVASYAGDDNTEAGERTATLRVAKAATTATTTVTKAPTTKKAGKAKVVVATDSGSALGGRSAVVLRRANGTKVRSWSPGAAKPSTLTLPKLKAGTYRLVTSYAGNANHAAAKTRTVGFTVR
jgi:hypothetical protein